MAKHFSYSWQVFSYPVSIEVSGGFDREHLKKIAGVH